MTSASTLFRRCGRLLAAVLAAGVMTGPASAAATTYSFEQGGWTGGGLLSGSFSGEDLNGDGFLTSFDGEVTSFLASFSGNADVGATSFGQDTLLGLAYRLDGGPLGDDELPLGEGLLTQSPAFTLLSGVGAAGTPGGLLFGDSGMTTTDAAITVSTVPGPQTLLLMLGGLALLGASRAAARR